jgi:hypothetical protein
MRCANNLAVVLMSAKILGLPKKANVLDYGGGVGLLCRMLRDIGFDARVFDKYATNELASGFDDLGATPDLICSFEVAEHFADPRSDMAEILGRGAQLCIVGTETYKGQGADWWYISPLSGQHIFFYSENAMGYLATKHNYHYERIGNIHYFSRAPISRIRGGLLWRVLAESRLRFVRAYIGFTLSNRFAAADRLAAISKQTTYPAPEM